MKERPILFSGPMVRAILDGSKTQTRRVVKLPIEYDGRWAGKWKIVHKAVTLAMETFNMRLGKMVGKDPSVCPYGEPGDRLWVRETWALRRMADKAKAHEAHTNCVLSQGKLPGVFYIAGGDRDLTEWDYSSGRGRWRPSIHMPRWASRILLEIVSVRVERLHDLSEGDAIAEGIESMPCAVPDTKLWKNYNHGNGCTPSVGIPQNSFRSLWESINGEENWLSNPFVWVVEFKRVTP